MKRWKKLIIEFIEDSLGGEIMKERWKKKNVTLLNETYLSIKGVIVIEHCCGRRSGHRPRRFQVLKGVILISIFCYNNYSHFFLKHISLSYKKHSQHGVFVLIKIPF